MIIVSELSAKAAQPVRTDRYTPARHRSSAPAMTLPGSRTHGRSAPKSTIGAETKPCRWGVSLRDGLPRLGMRVVGHQGGAGIPSRQHRGCSRPGLLQDELADATGYPLRPHLSCEQNNQRCAVRVL
jgi:hypothetical protein